MSALNRTDLAGVWSATPTPFTDSMAIDTDSVKRMIDHHLRLGVKGLFLAGLVRSVSDCAAGRLAIAVQVTDNSTARILDNVAQAQEDGADIAVIAPPYFLLNATPENVTKLYVDAISDSALPVGVYDRGTHGAVVVPNECLSEIYGQDNVLLVKDSSTDPERRDIALAVREKRPELLLLDGDEFHCVEYIVAGYDGLLLGGGIFNAYIARQIIAAVHAGNVDEANALQERMNRMMYDVYGGETISCWLAGLKKLLVDMGIFSTWGHFLGYPVTDECQAAITRVIEQDADVLFP